MSDDSAPDEPAPAGAPGGATSRRALMLGAVGAASVLSIRPALAQTQASVLNCQLPVPDAGHSSSLINADGRLVPTGTPGAFRGSARPFTGEEVRQAMANGGNLPGTSNEQSRAYVNYIRRLQRGTSGFTCFASLQMPRG